MEYSLFAFFSERTLYLPSQKRRIDVVILAVPDVGSEAPLNPKSLFPCSTNLNFQSAYNPKSRSPSP